MYSLRRKGHKLIQKTVQICQERGAFVALQQVTFRLYQAFRKDSVGRTLTQRKNILHKRDEIELQKDIIHILDNGFIFTEKDAKEALFSLSSTAQKDIINAADELLNGTYTLYGSLKVKFDDAFSWHLDPLTKYQWQTDCISREVATKKPDGVDIKTIWEISRFQFLCPLAYSYLLTGEKRYAAFSYEKLISWIEDNAMFTGPHWTRAMESSIRLINCITYLPLMVSSLTGVERTNLVAKFTSFVVDHLVYIATNPEYSPAIRNNHYLANQVGLIVGGAIFPERDWFAITAAKARQNFFNEILLQFREDGVNYEGSLPYHRLSSEIAAIGFILLNKVGVDIPEEIVERLNSIIAFTEVYTSLSNATPVIGDNDSGIFLKLFIGQETSSHAYLNCLLSVAKNPRAGLQDNLLHLLAYSNQSYLVALLESNCHLQKGERIYSGVYDGLMVAQNNKNSIILNSLNNGMWGSGGHTHNDKLSVYPAFDGIDLFVDRGCYSYTGFPETRMIDRSALSHNGPVVNGYEQNLYGKDDAFHMFGNAVCGREMKQSGDEICLLAWYDSMQSQKIKLRMYRRIVWNIVDRSMSMSDWFTSDFYTHDMKMSWNFLINPHWTCKLKDRVLVFTDKNRFLSLRVPESAEVCLSMSSYAPHYQVEEKCSSLSLLVSTRSESKNNFFIKY